MWRPGSPSLGRGPLHPQGRRLVRDRLPVGRPEEGTGGGEEGGRRRRSEPGAGGGQAGWGDLGRDVVRRRGDISGEADPGPIQLTGAPGPIPSRRRALPPRTNTSTRPELSTTAPRARSGRSA